MHAPSATLVIGATGTTGSRVVAGLVAEGHCVKAALPKRHPGGGCGGCPLRLERARDLR